MDSSNKDWKEYLDVWKWMEARGEDASGIAIYYNNNKLTLSKMPIPSSIHSSYFAKLNIPIKNIKLSIAHARAATSGSPIKNENNHPLYQYLDGKLITLVHNGVIFSGNERIREVDSDSLFYYIRKEKEFNDNVMIKTLENTTGTLAILITDGDVLYFYRNTSPLEYVEYDNFIVFASENLNKIYDKEVKKVEPYKLYKVEYGEIKEIADINTLGYTYIR